jgi:hypothetical protein
MPKQQSGHSRWGFLRSEGVGPLAAIFLGGFIAWTIFEIFLRPSWLCSSHEEVVICARAWLSVFWTAIAAIGTTGALIYLAVQASSARRSFEQKEIDDLKAELHTANEMAGAVDRVQRPIWAPPSDFETAGILSEAETAAEDAKQKAQRKYFVEVTRVVGGFYPRLNVFFAMSGSAELNRARSSVVRSMSELGKATRRLQEGLNMTTVATGDAAGRRILLARLLSDCETRTNQVSESLAGWRDAIFAEIAARRDR